MSKFIVGRGIAKFNNVNDVENAEYVYFYVNAPAPNEVRLVCGPNCNCPKHRKIASENAIPDYEYLKFLGSGGFGAVHLYQDRETRRTFAIKSVSYMSQGQNNFYQISSEYDIVHHIDHPNIIKYYKFFSNPILDKCYIVMEYAARGSLRKFINEQRKKNQLFHAQLVLKIIRDIVSGVLYLNSQHVVHCDLKPDNILIGNDNLMKICDFGTAHFEYDINAPIALTINYMAPELFKNVRPNEKTEVWAIGIILYELCTLRHPFGYASNTAELVWIIQTGRFSPMTSIYSVDMTSLLHSMLYINPHQRHTLRNVLKNRLFHSSD